MLTTPKITKSAAQHRLMVFIFWVLLSGMLTVFPVTTKAQEISYSTYLYQDSTAIVKAGTGGIRYFGDLSIQYNIDSTGTVVVCTLTLNTVIVGIVSLTGTNPVYPFDVKSGFGSANGTLSLNLVYPPLIATLKGDFSYSVWSNNTYYPFKGDLVGWYIYN